MDWSTILPNHLVWDTIVVFWIFSVAVNALFVLTDDSSSVYWWIYTFLTTLLGHVSDAMNQRHQAAAERALQQSGPTSNKGATNVPEPRK